MAPIAHRSTSVLLDITRLTSRVGTGPLTGVDRVEAAYLDWCLDTDAPLKCLARVSGGFVLLDRAGALAFRKKLTGQVAWGPRDLRGLVGLKTSKQRAQAESDLRRLAIASCSRTGLNSLQGHLGADSSTYLNVGHSNLSEQVLEFLKDNKHTITVLVHDLIPLELPEFQKPETVKSFESRMKAVAAKADLVIANSKATASSVVDTFKKWGFDGKIVSNHLGIDVPQIAESHELVKGGPGFITLGTIEPRKGHALLLDVWDMLGAEFALGEIPTLQIVGRRGWNNSEVFNRLDKLDPNGPVSEHNDLTDQELWPLLSNAHALLFPSLAEGFGLPSLEAAALGVPVVCGDLAIHHELLGDYPVYADVTDPYLWKKIIVDMAKNRQERSKIKGRPPIPTWEAHFERVNTALMQIA